MCTFIIILDESVCLINVHVDKGQRTNCHKFGIIKILLTFLSLVLTKDAFI